MGKIFCSYRQKDRDKLRILVDKLSKRLNDYVFFDERIESDDVKSLLKEVEQCAVFLLFVTHNTLDPSRILSPTDWVHQEIALALQRDKPIVQVFYDQQPPKRENLPDDIADLADKIGLHCDSQISDNFADQVADKCIAISNHALSRKQVVHVDDSAIQQRIALLRQEREKLLKQKGLLLADQQTPKTTSQTIIGMVVVGIMLGLCGFALHPAFGVAVLIVGVIAVFALSGNSSSVKHEENQSAIARIDGRLRQIDGELAKARRTS